jgi:hypothetical protein
MQSRHRTALLPGIHFVVLRIYEGVLKALRRRSSLSRIPDELLADVLCDARDVETERARRNAMRAPTDWRRH